MQSVGAAHGATMASAVQGREVDNAAVAAAVSAAGSDSAVTGLLNSSPAADVVSHLLGPVPAATGAQVALLWPGGGAAQADNANRFTAAGVAVGDDSIGQAGYPIKDVPFRHWFGHLDGLWNGGCLPPQSREEDAEGWDAEQATNGALRSPAEGCNLANSFTCLLGIALSDQTEEGSGNLGLLRGAHTHMAEFFQAQQQAGGPLGPDGPGWPREDPNAPNGRGLVFIPPPVVEKYEADGERTADGRLWARPTMMKLKPGDAVLVLHSVPHCASLNDLGADPRIMIYFRLTPEARPQEARPCYPAALLDPWLEWPGMREGGAEGGGGGAGAARL